MEPLFVAFTLAMGLAAALAGYHAATHGDLGFYGVSLVYGFVLEQLVILRFDAYTYPVDAYLLTLVDVPLAISLGWGAILYAGFTTAMHYDLPPSRVPAFAALFALHVDLSMDVVAASVGYWTWIGGGVWFGVPLGNFFGWFCVTFLYTGSYLAVRARIDSDLAAAVVALATSLVALIASLTLWVEFVPRPGGQALVLSIVVLVSAVAVARSDYRPSPVPAPLQYAIFVFHVFFLGLYVGTGMLFESRYVLLAPIALGMFAIGYLVLHQPSLAVVTRLRDRAVGS